MTVGVELNHQLSWSYDPLSSSPSTPSVAAATAKNLRGSSLCPFFSVPPSPAILSLPVGEAEGGRCYMRTQTQPESGTLALHCNQESHCPGKGKRQAGSNNKTDRDIQHGTRPTNSDSKRSTEQEKKNKGVRKRKTDRQAGRKGRRFRDKLRKDEIEVDTATATSAQSSSSSSSSALSSSPSSPAPAEEKEAKEKTDRRDQEEQKQQGQRDETGRVARGATKQQGVTTHN